MTLSQQRILFSKMVSRLLQQLDKHAHELDYAIDFVKRCESCLVGKPYSKHKSGLAIDIHLYDKEGRYLSGGSEHIPFGEYWESIGGSWGGRFDDSNHYSLGE